MLETLPHGRLAGVEGRVGGSQLYNTRGHCETTDHGPEACNSSTRAQESQQPWTHGQ